MPVRTEDRDHEGTESLARRSRQPNGDFDGPAGNPNKECRRKKGCRHEKAQKTRDDLND